MQRFLSKIFILIASLCFAITAYAEKFTLDPMHSYVQWHINHMGFSNQTGKWYVEEGVLVLDPENPQNSTVKATIKIDSLITGIPKLDKHLMSDEFFDVEKFPTATFASTAVEVTNKNTARVTGTLTLHGVSKPVTLDVTLNQVGASPATKKKTVGFSATTQIKRSDFGITTYLPALGDEVNLTIEAEGYKD